MAAVFRMKGRTGRWAWRTGPSPLLWDLNGRRLGGSVQSCALHPDGRIIFASSHDFTFSLDAGTGASAVRGKWCLPFEGRAFYDASLGAWVGVRTVWLDDDDDDFNFNRRSRRSSSSHLCFCDGLLYAYDEYGYVAAPPLPKPKWEACEQELTFRDDDDDDGELQPGRSGGNPRRGFLHTGRGRFCLVETWPAARSRESPCTCSGDGVEHLLLVTMFRARRAKNGELVVSPGRSYIVPNYCSDPPLAFWM